MSECTCTERAKEKKQILKNRTYKFQGMRLVYTEVPVSEEFPKGRDYITVVDSFGMRSQIKGECEPCWNEYVEGYNKTMEGMYD